MQNEQCELCEALTPVIHHALYEKYCSSQNFYYTKPINEIVEDQFSKAVVEFKQYNYIDDNEQYLKREYGIHEFNGKIQMLAEYYKFHRDVIPLFDQPIEKIMNKYYDRIKENDYKKIKNILKAQQNISLTTQKSQSSIEDSGYEKKSKYSTVLHGLEEQSGVGESKLLGQICQRIDLAFAKVKLNNDFKGVYSTGEKQFQSFLRKQETRKKKISSKFLQLKGFEKQKIKIGLTKPRGKQMWKRSMEKTTVNDTISREEKNRKIDKLTNVKIGIKSTQLSLEKKQPLFKQFTNVINFKSNSRIKTVDQIYCGTSKTKPPSLTRKNSIISNSITKNIIKPSTSKSLKRLPQFQIKQIKVINEIQDRSPADKLLKKGPSGLNKVQSSEKNLRVRQKSEKRTLRTFSSKQLNVQKQRNPIIKYDSSELQLKKAKITMENLLEKKLDLGKRKQPIF